MTPCLKCNRNFSIKIARYVEHFANNLALFILTGYDLMEFYQLVPWNRPVLSV